MVTQKLGLTDEEDVLDIFADPRSDMVVTTTNLFKIVFQSPVTKSKRMVRTEPGGGRASVERSMALASHYLHSRPKAVDVGNLLIATRDGAVHLWRAHKNAEYEAQFAATHVSGDYVTCMTSDARDQYLFTGFSHGYVKTWHVATFGCPRSTATASKQSLRLRFPYLLHSLFIGRAQRAAAKNTTGPLLVNSYRAHKQTVTHVEYVNGFELLVTSSVDKNIRVWTLDGHFVGVLGE